MISSHSFALLLTLVVATTLWGQAHAQHSYPPACYEPNPPPTSNCPPPGTLRFLSASSLLQEEDTMDMLQDCENLDYRVAISVTGTHVGLTATPNQVSQECPILFLHDIVGKQIDTSSDTYSVEQIPQYEIGSFALKTILDAFDGAADSSGEAYNLITNNCATLVISMMNGLDVPITADHIAFVAANLLEQDHDNWILRTLRSHKLVAKKFLRANLTPDLGIMYDFVAEYVERYRREAHHSNLESHPRESHHPIRKLWCYVIFPRGFVC